jgi:AraC-like DNA-binding protein
VRILRLQRALVLAYGGVATADAAARSGYADQPHLARDVKELTGVSLGTLTR